jgi:hypothetical protein
VRDDLADACLPQRVALDEEVRPDAHVRSCRSGAAAVTWPTFGASDLGGKGEYRLPPTGYFGSHMCVCRAIR